MTSEMKTSIKVDYKFRDGWHVFTSKELCGLYVASTDPEKAYNDVADAVVKLIKLNDGLECKASPELNLFEFLRTLRQQHVASTKAQPKKVATPAAIQSRRFDVYACA